MVVEDEAIIALDLKTKLTEFGYDVTGVTDSSDEALELMGSNRPDLVLMDIVLRGEDNGIDLSWKIKDILDIPIVFLTAYTDQDTLERAKRVGPYGYIVKPYTDRELQSTIEVAIYKHGMERELREKESLFRSIFELAPNLILLTDTRGTIVASNPQSDTHLGHTRERLLGMSVLDITHPDDRKRLEITMREVMEGAAPAIREHRMVRDDGSVIIVRTNFSMLRSSNGNGKASGRSPLLICIIEDITESRHRERDMQRRLLRYELDEGNLYGIGERDPVMVREIFGDLLRAGFAGTSITRATDHELGNTVGETHEQIWLGKKNAKGVVAPDPEEFIKALNRIPDKRAVLIERIDRLFEKPKGASISELIQDIRDVTHLKQLITLVGYDPRLFSKRDMALLEKEILPIRSAAVPNLPPEMMEIIQHVYRKNMMMIRPTITDICNETHSSKPTVRKRLKQLTEANLIRVEEKGRTKIVEITEKGKRFVID